MIEHGVEGALRGLADDLDELRRSAGLTYRVLARHTGRPRSTLNDALTGRRFPRLDTVLAIVRACGGDDASWRARWVAADRLRATRSGQLTSVPVEHALEQLTWLPQPGRTSDVVRDCPTSSEILAGYLLAHIYLQLPDSLGQDS